MALQHAKESRHVAIAVVDHLGLRGQPPAQEHAAHADEGFGIEPVRDGLDALHDPPRQLPLAADITRRRTRRSDHPEILV